MRHLNTECEELAETDAIFEDTINKEYGFIDEDLEKQLAHVNNLFQRKCTKVEELEKK